MYDLVGDPGDMNYQLYTGPGTEAFNTAAFARPATGTFGNAPRNAWYNPGEQQWDLALFKNFTLGGTRRLQFRAEAFNFINHPNLGIGGTVVDLAGFLNPTETLAAPRRLAAGVRIMF